MSISATASCNISFIANLGLGFVVLTTVSVGYDIVINKFLAEITKYDSVVSKEARNSSGQTIKNKTTSIIRGKL